MRELFLWQFDDIFDVKFYRRIAKHSLVEEITENSQDYNVTGQRMGGTYTLAILYT